MGEIKIFDSEYRLMNIIWENNNIKSSELVKLAKEELGWKKSTTYTVIRRLCEREIIKNKNTIVSFLVNRQEVIRAETEEHIDKLYEGSLKLFFTTFLKKEKLNKDEIDELRKIVEENEEREE
ncbi:BlaI/MecI/CopY family transcriptional regulator [Clostridium botulinum]|uniref:CopY family transcriptional regulator n=1 Tax=Clostridium botulinum C/D str. DC5 TaxID=1443128 RepID=A0A0A0ILX0_CLOBO|nr:BlaI/MecI/CopY family transcriptional regulator [Clostridium botulinum]KEI04819.1 CopY family transcriptional regulator [Clostridium botulinum C/D str. BKT75002]KEI08583.1 CopY family transcriptional regulator [Clostridium botulinum C/D str. BKT2873]KGM95402.1 CopY family transcriptional regulator [Clostridium botulinum D str. CCUG 7971]KGN00546.1 CopY family transcriptional regulator [Clostridium botulinum C/D str. DC5]KOC46317.1 CopY family transcriptional regulator [Clostridium botulinum